MRLVAWTMPAFLFALPCCEQVKAFAQPAGGAQATTATCPPLPSAPPVTPTPESAVGVFQSNPKAVKEVLSKRVHGDQATPDNIRLLQAVCANAHDDACVADCQLLLVPQDAPAPKKSAVDQAREALLQGRPEAAKTLLLPIAAKGKPSPEELKVLKAACDALKDRACLDVVKAKH